MIVVTWADVVAQLVSLRVAYCDFDGTQHEGIIVVIYYKFDL